MTYRECYEEGCAVLEAAGIEEAALDARLLLETVCHTDRNTLLAHGERTVAEEEERRYRDWTAKRARRIPLQHITGEQNFMGLRFRVNGDVLIPRQDTEILVEEVMRELHDGMRILDLCTGSGCILLSLLHYSNDCTGVGTDISREALAVAQENAERVGCGGRALFLQSDLFERVTGSYEIIVSNPPYIPSGVIPTLMPEVREHEPLRALDGGADGLLFYRTIVKESRAYLAGGGKLYLEIGYDQAEAVSGLLREAGFAEVTVAKDYAGLDRVVYGTSRSQEGRKRGSYV